jgi:hypothetical protein
MIELDNGIYNNSQQKYFYLKDITKFSYSIKNNKLYEENRIIKIINY